MNPLIQAKGSSDFLPTLMRSKAAVIFLGISVAISAGKVCAQQMVITFDDPPSLAALFYKPRSGAIVRAGRYAWVPGRDDADGNAYVEHGMKFFNGLNPPDPALGSYPQSWYTLNYEEPALNNPDVMAKLPDPENHPRYLSPHMPGAVIQITYDANGDGIPDPFNLISIDVLYGALNLGTKSVDGSIAVYNNLTAGFTWSLIDATNLIRATIELPLDSKAFGAAGCGVDDIVFEPATGPRRASSPATPDKREHFAPPFIDPPPLSFSFTNRAPLPKIDVKPSDRMNVIDSQDTGELPVAIITTRGFDAPSVDCSSIRLGPNATTATARQCTVQDVNGDGHADLLAVFSIPDIGLQCGDSFLVLTGQADGRTVTSFDFIRLVGCEHQRHDGRRQ